MNYAQNVPIRNVEIFDKFLKENLKTELLKSYNLEAYAMETIDDALSTMDGSLVEKTDSRLRKSYNFEALSDSKDGTPKFYEFIAEYKFAEDEDDGDEVGDLILTSIEF